jgi:hypothetical protein
MTKITIPIGPLGGKRLYASASLHPGDNPLNGVFRVEAHDLDGLFTKIAPILENDNDRELLRQHFAEHKWWEGVREVSEDDLKTFMRLPADWP